MMENTHTHFVAGNNLTFPLISIPKCVCDKRRTNQKCFVSNSFKLTHNFENCGFYRFLSMNCNVSGGFRVKLFKHVKSFSKKEFENTKKNQRILQNSKVECIINSEYVYFFLKKRQEHKNSSYFSDRYLFKWST